MNRLRKKWQKNEIEPNKRRGQGLIEYVLILMFVGIASVLVIQLMEPQIGLIFSRIVGEAPVAPPALLAYTPPPTATDTPTPDPNASATPTSTATNTNTPLPPTSTSTLTPLPTATATHTPLPTDTPTPTPTFTPEPTNTPTNTPIPTDTPTPRPVTITLISINSEDGFLREAGNSNSGGFSSTSDIRIGDNGADRQLMGVVSFNTATIPDGAIIQSAVLRVQRRNYTGQPYGKLGAILYDIAFSSGFSGSYTLESSDFESSAAIRNAGTLSNATSNFDWATATLNSVALNNIYINSGQHTQFRLRFPVDDSNDRTMDRIDFFVSTAELIITYVP